MKRNNGSDEGEGRGGSGHVANYGGKGFREEQCSRREISYCFASSFYSRSFLARALRYNRLMPPEQRGYVAYYYTVVRRVNVTLIGSNKFNQLLCRG